MLPCRGLSRYSTRAVFLLALLGLVGAAPPARAIEITAFLTRNYPTENWNTGLGVDVTLGFLKLGAFGVEATRHRSPDTQRGMTSVTAQAMLVVPIKKFRLYGGLGSGVFYEGKGVFNDSDFGSLNALFFGAKVRLADLVILKAEYRRIGLSGEPPLAWDQRFSVGGGIAF